MKSKSIIAALLFALTNQAYADATLFEGLALDVSTGYQQTERDTESTLIRNGVATPIVTASTDEGSANAALGVSYSFALSSNYLVGIGFDYNFTDLDIGRPLVDSDPAESTVTFELTNVMNLYVKPQFMISDTSQIYAKLAYTRADLEANDAVVDFIGNTEPSLDGYSIGGGFANMINDNVSLFIEANYFNYGEEDTTFRYDGSIGGLTSIGVASDIDGYNAKIGIAYVF